MPKVIDGDGTVIDGDGARATAATLVIDSFERNSSGPGSQYSGTTGEFEIINDSTLSFSAINGSRVLKNPGGLGFSEILSTSGLPHYFPKGSIATCFMRASTDEGRPRVYFAVKDTDNWFCIQYNRDASDNIFKIYRTVDGNLTKPAKVNTTYAADQWMEVVITRDDGTLGGSDNDIVTELTPRSGGTTTTLSINDSTFADQDGIGFGGQLNDTADLYFDFYHR